MNQALLAKLKDMQEQLAKSGIEDAERLSTDFAYAIRLAESPDSASLAANYFASLTYRSTELMLKYAKT